MSPQEYQALLLTAVEQLTPRLPAPAVARIDAILTEAVMSGWDENLTSKLGQSLVIAYSTYIDRKFNCIWKADNAQH